MAWLSQSWKDDRKAFLEHGVSMIDKIYACASLQSIIECIVSKICCCATVLVGGYLLRIKSRDVVE